MSLRLVADIGGTNTRIALFDPLRSEFRALRFYKNREFSQLEDIIEHWLEHLPEAKPRVCCIAVAALPSTDQVTMTNIDWSFSCRELASRFGFDQLRCLNDFEAHAYALPYLNDSEKELLFPGAGQPGGRLATLGPGTGLGGAILDWHNGQPRSIACEPGHMGLTPATGLELEVFRLLLADHSNIYAELLVSGPGLARLHQALGEIRGEPARRHSPAEISRMAMTGEDRLCVSALDTFCALLGSVCGDFLLANGSYGGLYLAGGIVPEIIDFIRKSTFRQRLIEKGAMGKTLAEIPVYAITSKQPGLLGAARVPL
jgi:glucokinase